MAKKYKFKIENDTHEWDTQFIKGSDVRGVPPGIPDNMDLFLKVKGAAGRLILNDDQVDLEDAGIEKFYAQDASSEAGEA
ncbi:MAG: hypothetical protein C0481_02765 [Phenylobacterium sp.]|uniref:hypothetical protein n=1 Tax=Phenylobacterium sp. TaxID=1871053 RepID=UPI0025F06D17|nr:hypothetical protein [Phenylobacterium sp.]MBA4010766.1 hypothetical protein [Phenylobacterium sp.]